MKKTTLILSLLFIVSVFSCKKETVETVEACFTLTKVGFEVNEVIRFNNCSSGAERYLWDFNDGTTTETAYPEHTYTKAGMYSVVLTAYGEKTQKTYTTVIYITEKPTGK